MADGTRRTTLSWLIDAVIPLVSTILRFLTQSLRALRLYVSPAGTMFYVKTVFRKGFIKRARSAQWYNQRLYERRAYTNGTLERRNWASYA